MVLLVFLLALLARDTEASSATFPKYKKEGTVKVTIGSDVFVVPRIILGSVAPINDEKRLITYCEVANEIDARLLQIFVTKTHAGTDFYNQWIRERRLPYAIEIHRREARRSYTPQRLEFAKSSGYPSGPDRDGFKTTIMPGYTYLDGANLDLRSPDGNAIVFLCSTSQTPRSGYLCSASYVYDDAIGVLYHFNDAVFPSAEWAKLDARVRMFISEIMQRQ